MLKHRFRSNRVLATGTGFPCPISILVWQYQQACRLNWNAIHLLHLNNFSFLQLRAVPFSMWFSRLYTVSFILVLVGRHTHAQHFPSNFKQRRRRLPSVSREPLVQSLHIRGTFGWCSNFRTRLFDKIVCGLTVRTFESIDNFFFENQHSR